MNKLFVFFTLSVLFVSLFLINIFFLDGIPHVPDSASYLFMAKMVTSGNISPSIPIDGAFVDFFPGILDVSQNTWTFQYTYGHPLLLSIGILIGMPQLIPPLIGIGMMLLLFLILREVGDEVGSYVVILLAFLSPFFLMNASSFMGHNTAALYLSLSLFFLILGVQKKYIFGSFLSGFFLGFLFNTRPLTAVPFCITFVLFLAIYSHTKKIIHLIVFCAGFFILFLAWLILNDIVSGHPFNSQYYSQSQGFFHLDQSLNTYLTQRLQNVLILSKNYASTIYNFPMFIFPLLIVLPFVLKRFTKWETFFLINIFCLPIVYFFYNGTFLMYGPRFWYESIPFVFLLSARSISIMWHRYKLPTLAGICLLSLFSFLRFFSLIPSSNEDMMSPLQLTQLKGINAIDDRLIRTAQEKGIKNAIIFIKPCDPNWWCYGSVFAQNDPSLSTTIIYLKDLGDIKNRELKTKYPNRTFYKANYETNTIEEHTLF